MRKLVLISLFSIWSAAGSAAVIELDGVDITSVVDAARERTFRVARPVHVYNWGKSGDIAERPDAHEIIGSWARAYWDNYGKPLERLNYFGRGLYVAVDPVTSSWHGLSGGHQNWLLTEMSLPAGLLALDLVGEFPLPRSARVVNLSFGCPGDAWARDYFADGGARLTESCRRLVRKVFGETLGIEALFYDYQYKEFAGCDAEDQARAFVLLDDHWMNADSIRVFNSRSRALPANRLRIQSLFLAGASTKITANAAQNQPWLKGLLWPDMEGQRKPRDLKEWLRENKFGCSRRVDYRN